MPWVEIVTLATAVVVLLTSIATLRTKKQLGNTEKQVGQVHQLVNSRMAEMVRRVDQLTVALQVSDIEVPPPPPVDPAR